MLAVRLVGALAGASLLCACAEEPAADEVGESDGDDVEMSEEPPPEGNGDTGDIPEPEPSATLEEVEAACRAKCEGERTLECFPYPQISADTCTDSCVFTAETYGDFCRTEYIEHLGCAAEAMECVDGDLMWADACIDPMSAWNACIRGSDCKLSCDARSEAGCDDFGDCYVACVDEKESLSFACQRAFTDMHLCVAAAANACEPAEACAELMQAYEAC